MIHTPVFGPEPLAWPVSLVPWCLFALWILVALHYMWKRRRRRRKTPARYQQAAAPCSYFRRGKCQTGNEPWPWCTEEDQVRCIAYKPARRTVVTTKRPLTDRQIGNRADIRSW